MNTSSYPCDVDDDNGTNPPWARGLKKYGNYYEGIVERAELVLEMHKQETVTTFGIRRTERPRSAPAVGKENVNKQDSEHKDSTDKPRVCNKIKS